MGKLLVILAVFSLAAGFAFAENDNKGGGDKVKKERKAPDEKEMELSGKIVVFEKDGVRTNMIDTKDYGKLELPAKSIPKDIQKYLDKDVKMKVRLAMTHKWNKITEILSIEEAKEVRKN